MHAENLEENLERVSDWPLEIPVLHQEMEHAGQPIRNGVILNLSYNKRYKVDDERKARRKQEGFFEIYLITDKIYIIHATKIAYLVYGEQNSEERCLT